MMLAYYWILSIISWILFCAMLVASVQGKYIEAIMMGMIAFPCCVLSFAAWLAYLEETDKK